MARGAILLGNEVPFLWEWLPATIIAARCRSHRTEKGDFIGSPTSALSFIALSLRRTMRTPRDMRFVRLYKSRTTPDHGLTRRC